MKRWTVWILVAAALVCLADSSIPDAVRQSKNNAVPGEEPKSPAEDHKSKKMHPHPTVRKIRALAAQGNEESGANRKRDVPDLVHNRKKRGILLRLGKPGLYGPKVFKTYPRGWKPFRPNFKSKTRSKAKAKPQQTKLELSQPINKT